MSEITTPLDPALYESRAGVPIAVVVTSLTVAVAAVSLRTYARAVLIRQFGADDWAAIVALTFAMGSGIMVASSALPQLRLVFIGPETDQLLPDTINGQGRHLAVVDLSLLPNYFRVRRQIPIYHTNSSD